MPQLSLRHFLFVRAKGLEPSHREAPDPKSGVSTNFTTPASNWILYQNEVANIRIFRNIQTKNQKNILSQIFNMILRLYPYL